MADGLQTLSMRSLAFVQDHWKAMKDFQQINDKVIKALKRRLMYHKEWTLARRGGVLFYGFSYMLHFCNHHHNQDSEQFLKSPKSLMLTLCHNPSSVPSPCSR